MSASALARPAPPGRGVLAAAWDALVPAHFAVAIALAAAWGGANAIGFWLSDDARELPRLVLHFTLESLLPLLLLVPLLAIADALCAEQPRRVAPYVVAAIGAAVGGEVLFHWIAPLAGTAQCGCTMDGWPQGSQVANMLPDSLIICGFITAGYRYRRRALQRTARVRAAELDHARLTREMQEARLAALQACIEPQLLFDTLRDAGSVQQDDPKRATQLIDDLIAYLRAALPHLAATRSTVGKECGLVTAWLALQRLRDPGLPPFELAVVGDAHDAHLPPMVLLPLVDVALRAAARRATPRPLAMRAAIEGGLLCVTLRGGRDVFRTEGEAGPVIATVRERLRAVHGRAARIDLGATDTDSWLALELPYERRLPTPPTAPER
ncbi:MAG: histidine kinase [Burkholderiales bacterium]